MVALPAAAAGDVGLNGRWSFRALNTSVTIFTRDWPGHELLRAAEAVFHGFEDRLSRFRATSELSLLNASAGAEVAVSPELFELLHLCRRFHEDSGGLFDPAVLPALEAAGYDRSFELVARDGESPAARLAQHAPFADAALDAATSTVTLPKGVRIDLGGIGKGHIVDVAAGVLTPAWDFLVDAGGDIRASGDGPDGGGWVVGVAGPLEPAGNLSIVRLHNEALATSSITHRRWRRGGQWRHHLIDPVSGVPVENDVLAVSVIAPSAVEADVYAKVALLLGRDAGRSYLEARGAHGFFVLSNGAQCTTSAWPGGPQHETSKRTCIITPTHHDRGLRDRGVRQPRRAVRLRRERRR